MSGQTPRTPEQRPIGVAPGTPPDQRTQPQLPNAPPRRRRQATGSRGVRRRLNLGGDGDISDNERRRERQQQLDRDIDEAAQEGQRRGDIVSSEPTTQALMNVPELKL